MAHRKKRKITVSYEWSGFLNTTPLSLLTTVTAQELLGDAMQGSVGTPDLTVHRIVGLISVRPNASATSAGMIGLEIQRVVADSTSAIVVNSPLDTDIDARANDVMWGWHGRPELNLSITDDSGTFLIPVDVRIKRRLDKRHGVVLASLADATGRYEIQTALRVLTSHG